MDSLAAVLGHRPACKLSENCRDLSGYALPFHVRYAACGGGSLRLRPALPEAGRDRARLKTEVLCPLAHIRAAPGGDRAVFPQRNSHGVYLFPVLTLLPIPRQVPTFSGNPPIIIFFVN